MIKRLVKQLRDEADLDARAGEPLGKRMREAADKLEELAAENARLRAELSMWQEVKHSSHWKERAISAEATIKQSLPVAWRDIPCREIDWRSSGISTRSLAPLRHLCSSFINGEWEDRTLGDIADMGERQWRSNPGIGDKAIAVIKATIEMAADGKTVTKVPAADAYVPTSERDEARDE